MLSRPRFFLRSASIAALALCAATAASAHTGISGREAAVDPSAPTLAPAPFADGETDTDDPTADDSTQDGPTSLLASIRLPAPTEADLLRLSEDAYAAGIRGDLEGATGDGDLTVVPGTEDAPREAGTTYQVRVEVEDGLPVDGETFADYALSVLNDERGWGHDGSVAFARTDSEDADFAVTLASPETSIDLCTPLDVGGIYSCGRNGRAVLNSDRFAAAIEPFLEAGGDVPQYREYLVNHEVGHLIGHAHVDCQDPGEPAPVMVQQSIDLQGCTPNGWPVDG
ncbi:MAG: DUF3152 domain-containing protein [Actinomycetaceae bacterium]